MRDALIVFARLPRPGQVKTRLCPPLSSEQAAALYAAMLDDVLEVTAEAARRYDLDAVLEVTPERGVSELRERCPAGFRVLPQRGRDLSERMRRALAAATARGAQRVLLRGSDSPALPAERIGEALEALVDHELVVSPDRDGGYALIGLRGSAPDLFSHPMSTPHVLRDTLEQARRAGLRSHLLKAGFDIDRVADLRWLDEARAAGRASACPRTLRYLDEHALWQLAHRPSSGVLAEGRSAR